jgi:rubredoxin
LNLISSTEAFTSHISLAANASSRTSTSNLQMIFGFGEKDDGKPGDYLCKDCGYVFTKGPDAWAKLPDNYKCPPCGAPKFRFKKVPKGSEKGTKVEVKKSWF